MSAPTELRIATNLTQVIHLDIPTWRQHGLSSLVFDQGYVVGAGGTPMSATTKAAIIAANLKGITPVVGLKLANYYKKPVLVDWFDQAGWDTLLTAYSARIAEAIACGVTRFHTDAEEYNSNAGNGQYAADRPGGAYWQLRPQVATGTWPTYPHTPAEQCYAAYLRGYVLGRLFVDAIPTVSFSHYYVKFPGGFDDQLQQKVNHHAPAVNNPMASFYAGWIQAGGRHTFANYELDKVRSNMGTWDECLAMDRMSYPWLATHVSGWDAAVAGDVSFAGACAISAIEDGVGAFKQVYPPAYVGAQLAAMARANPLVVLYEQKLSTFNYQPYFSAIKATSEMTR